jgi:hypothetical protein
VSPTHFFGQSATIIQKRGISDMTFLLTNMEAVFEADFCNFFNLVFFQINK